MFRKDVAVLILLTLTTIVWPTEDVNHTNDDSTLVSSKNIFLDASKKELNSENTYNSIVKTCGKEILLKHIFLKTSPLKEIDCIDECKVARRRCVHNKNISRTNFDGPMVLNFTAFIDTIDKQPTTACSAVLFYANWCQFSMKFAPNFNALGRIYTNLDSFAVEVSQTNSFMTRYRTVAVPTLLLFEGPRVFAIYHSSNDTLPALAEFVTNRTGLKISQSIELETLSQDFIGPVPSELTVGTNWIYLASISFILFFVMMKVSC